MQDNLDDAVAALVRAVRDPGVSPDYHFRVAAQVEALWPSLMNAVIRIVTAYDAKPDDTASTRIELPDGTIEYRNSAGELHNENGPAVLHPDGWCDWWINGKQPGGIT